MNAAQANVQHWVILSWLAKNHQEVFTSPEAANMNYVVARPAEKEGDPPLLTYCAKKKHAIRQCIDDAHAVFEYRFSDESVLLL